jgi:glycerol 3-phosphatase-1
MDGTLIDSSPAVVVAWETMHKTYPFLDLPHILRSAHGYRTTEYVCSVLLSFIVARPAS